MSANGVELEFRVLRGITLSAEDCEAAVLLTKQTMFDALSKTATGRILRPSRSGAVSFGLNDF